MEEKSTYGDPMKFDYEDFFARDPNPLEDDFDERDLREFGYFCREVMEGRNPPKWLLESIAKKILPVVSGGQWQDHVKLPWDDVRSPYSRRGSRAIEIYFNVEWVRSSKPQASITDEIRATANEFCISFEAARADYYGIKNAMDGKSDVPLWVYRKGEYRNTFLFFEENN